MTDPECPECWQNIGLTLAGKFKSHKVRSEQDETRPKCPGSGARWTPLPPEAPCKTETNSGPTPPESAKSATCSSTSDTSEAPTPSDTTSPDTGVSSTETLPGVETYEKGMQAARESTPPLFNRPAPLFDRPTQTRASRGTAKPFIPMEGKAAEVAGRMKEMFHAYSNRMDRNQQPTMGPSEIGSPCNRRIGMSLLRFPAVNGGGDNWASFVGTQIHRGLEDMLLWANAGSGRYQTEVKLQFPSTFVPFGTTDLIDTLLLMVDDHKCMGSWSLNKLATEGPSPTYRVQAHTYGYGAKLRGWDIKDVAIIAWPREKSSLDDLYVWTEPYQPAVAQEALSRVARIGAQLFRESGEVAEYLGQPPTDPYDLEIDPSDCRFCPFYLKGAAKSEGGVCNGRE